MSLIDGRKVSYRDHPDWIGIVQGDSYTPGNVRVQWRTPRVHTGAHAITDLVVLDKPEDNLSPEERDLFRPR
jgi:hypothetical protein